MSFKLTRKDLNLPSGDEEFAVYPLEITCEIDDLQVDPDGDPKVFVYRAAAGAQPGLGDVFSCIASPLQMRQLPENGPATAPDGKAIPFFRKAVLRLDCSSSAQLDYIWGEVIAQVTDLSANLALEGELQTTAVEIIP